MEGTISQGSLRQFTRALTTLAKYADDATITASETSLSLSSCGSAQSAFGRITFAWTFVERYMLKSNVPTQDSVSANSARIVRGSVNLKAVLSVLRNKSVQDTIDKCDIMIVERPPNADGELSEHVESKFVVRFQCKNGIVKTHRLSLDIPEDDMGPNVPASAPESTAKILVGAGVIKELLDHFQGFRKSDPQLQWEFDLADVKVKTVMHGAKGTDGGIASEISVEASEFSDYTVPHAPLGMCFQLKEFEATTALAEAQQVPLNIFFTQPGEPLWIETDTAHQNSLFVLSTAPLTGYSKTRAAVRTEATTLANGSSSNLGKRPRVYQVGAGASASSSSVRKRLATEDRDGPGSGSASRSASPHIAPAGGFDGQQGRESSPAIVGPSRQHSERPSFSAIENDTTIYQQAIGIDANNQAGPSKPRKAASHARRRPSPESQAIRSRPRKERPQVHERPLFLSTQDSAAPASQRQPYSSQHQRAPHQSQQQHLRYDQSDLGDDAPPILSQILPEDQLAQMRATGQGLEDMNADEFDALIAELNEDPEADLMNEDPDGLIRVGGMSQKSQTMRESETASQAPRKLGSGSAYIGSRRVIQQDDADEDEDENEVEEVDQLEDDGESFVPPTQTPAASIRNGRAFRPLFG